MNDHLNGGAPLTEPEETPTVECHPHSIEVVDRPEGYREFRCTPSYWRYPAAQAVESFATESLGENRGIDKYGLGEAVEFWSGSDASLRLQAVSPHDLANRELVALASRRSVGLNAPGPWLSESLIDKIRERWMTEHPEERSCKAAEQADAEPGSLWDHYGMRESGAEPVIYSYGMSPSDRPALGRIGKPWQGGTGTWFRWSTVRDWERWGRRQDVDTEAVKPTRGNLLLFVSHRWEFLDHPDRTGAQLACLKTGLQFALAKAVLHTKEEGKPEFKTGSGLPELLLEFLEAEFAPGDIESLVPWAQEIKRAGEASDSEESFFDACKASEPSESLAKIQSRVLIWYDYCSMLQAPRTESEEDAFRKEILTLNDIQAKACTVVIAGEPLYLHRAWCFLELCGGMRHRIAELTPSWGTRVGLGDSVTQWAHRSDQLISALCTHGLEVLGGSGLEATHPEDLPDIARLLAKLELTGLLATDDSDLVGGSLPVPFRSGRWEISGISADHRVKKHDGAAILDFGRLPDRDTLIELGQRCAEIDRLSGSLGVWVYTTNRALALAWADRIPEWWPQIRSALAAQPTFSMLHLPPADPPAEIACLWADSVSLPDDAAGWTRAIPSTAEILLILTHADLPRICRIYKDVVANHHARGVTVVTFCPENGKLLILPPLKKPKPVKRGWAVNVLAVPRIRRNTAIPSRMFLPRVSRPADVEVLAALRLDPREGFVPEGSVHVANEDGSYSATDEAVDAQWLLSHAVARTRVEGLARSIVGTWDDWLSRLVQKKYWMGGVVPHQLFIIERLLQSSLAASGSTYMRGRFLEWVLSDSTEQGTLLPDWLLDDVVTQAMAFRKVTDRS